MRYSNGAWIRKLDGPRRVGMNRAEWGLRYEAPKLVALRTAPAENSHIWEERRFRGTDARPILHWGIKEAEVGPVALAGKYTVRLNVDGQHFTQPLTISKDPKNPANDSDLEASFKMQLQIRDDISKTADAVNRIEWMRKQISVLEAMARSEGRKGRGDEKDGGDKDQQDKDPQEKDKADETNDRSNPAALLKSLQAMDQNMQSVE